jgi:hypothetical protein
MKESSWGVALSRSIICLMPLSAWSTTKRIYLFVIVHRANISTAKAWYRSYSRSFSRNKIDDMKQISIVEDGILIKLQGQFSSWPLPEYEMEVLFFGSNFTALTQKSSASWYIPKRKLVRPNLACTLGYSGFNLMLLSASHTAYVKFRILILQRGWPIGIIYMWSSPRWSKFQLLDLRLHIAIIIKKCTIVFGSFHFANNTSRNCHFLVIIFQIRRVDCGFSFSMFGNSFAIFEAVLNKLLTKFYDDFEVMLPMNFLSHFLPACHDQSTLCLLLISFSVIQIKNVNKLPIRIIVQNNSICNNN